jgi:signal transduction histidine kinase
MQPLARLRLRLTLWYLGTFASILGLLGAGLFLAARRRMSQQLDASLRFATSALIQAARIREVEQATVGGGERGGQGGGVVADAVDELHIPDRSLYLFDAGGRAIKPIEVPDWVAQAAREAGAIGRADRDFETPDDHIVRLHAERFAGTRGRLYVATAVADRLELEDEYASLIRALAAAALAALLLVAGGGYLLAHKSTAPIAQSMDHMRRFVADAAHELRTPVTLLRTRAEVALGQERDATRDAATFQAVERESARLGDIVGELLTLARADAGERAIAREPLYLDDVAAEAVDAVRALAEHKRIHLEVGGYEEARISGDAALVRQLLVIVLDNAVKFTPAGGHVRLEVAGQDGRATVLVADTGVGIPAEELPRVFERFYRGERAGRQADGAGLGLAIARWIAEAHGARIDIDSTPGGGTRVTISFPLLSESLHKEPS